MTEELRVEIVGWVNKNIRNYIIKAGGDYHKYLRENAIAKFGSGDQTDDAKELREQIAEVIRKRINCE